MLIVGDSPLLMFTFTGGRYRPCFYKRKQYVVLEKELNRQNGYSFARKCFDNLESEQNSKV